MSDLEFAFSWIAGIFMFFMSLNIVGGLLYDQYCGDGSIKRERVEPRFYERIEPK